MGIKVVTSYVTPEGFQVTEVYGRIVFFSFDVVSGIISARQEFSLSRDLRLNGKTIRSVPFTSDIFTFQAPAFPSVDMLYFHMKRQLTRTGLTVEDVLEPGQVASTYSEPEPVEAVATPVSPLPIGA